MRLEIVRDDGVSYYCSESEEVEGRIGVKDSVGKIGDGERGEEGC